MDEQESKLFFDSLVYVTDTLVKGFDVIELTDRMVHMCVELFDIQSAGIMLHDQRESLRLIAVSSDETKLLELLELLNEQGPCVEAFSTGREVTVEDLSGEAERWPLMVAEATAQGIVGAHAIPMRLRDQVIGVLNLFSEHPLGLTLEKTRMARVVADLATIGILNHRAIREQEVLAEQLQRALTSRVVIEQAKGAIAERNGVDMATAFTMLRQTARTLQRPLTDVASDCVSGVLPISGGAPHQASGTRQAHREAQSQTLPRT